MYKTITIKDAVRVPPKKFGSSIDASVLDVLRENYENKLDNDLGVIICVFKVRDIGDGRIISGDGATYHDVTFDALTFKPEVHETVEGKISEIVEFGAFMRIGPVDGLIHVSQVTDDFISYNEKTGTLAGKESGKILKEGDVVRGRVVTLSMKEPLTDSKIGITMRQPGLGKKEWIKEEKEKSTNKKPVKKEGEKK